MNTSKAREKRKMKDFMMFGGVGAMVAGLIWGAFAPAFMGLFYAGFASGMIGWLFMN